MKHYRLYEDCPEGFGPADMCSKDDTSGYLMIVTTPL
jgi:hypothetical protein